MAKSTFLNKLCKEVSVRTYLLLKRNGINTLDKLKNISEIQLLRLNGFGEIALREVKLFLNKVSFEDISSPPLNRNRITDLVKDICTKLNTESARRLAEFDKHVNISQTHIDDLRELKEDHHLLLHTLEGCKAEYREYRKAIHELQIEHNLALKRGEVLGIATKKTAEDSSTVFESGIYFNINDARKVMNKLVSTKEYFSVGIFKLIEIKQDWERVH